MIADPVIQVSLPVISVVTTYLIARQRLAGIVIALASQPLWIATAYLHRQWGVVVTACFNVCSLASGIGQWRRTAAPQADIGEAS